ncbi:MAG TPA: tetratricopeptide repeat protein [Vicinamibacterales bacterium]|nr:tetratricopeptide repeat protein [Vicinamibacterales bacterium]
MRIRIVSLLLLMLLSAAIVARAQNVEALRQQALIQLDRGDIQGAIQIFNRVVNEYPYDRNLVAQTLLQLGDCFQSLNQPSRGREYYERVISQYSDQTETVASARKRLAAATAMAEVPKGWILAGTKPADYETSVDHGTVFGGLPSAYLRSKKPKIDGFGTLMQSFSAEQYVGRRVRLSAFVKSENVQGWAGLWMRVDGKGGNAPLAFDNMQDRSIKGTTDWRNYDVVLDILPEAVSISIGILLGGTGTVWMNDTRVEEVGANIPTTDTRDRRKEPTNLRFDKK